MAHRFLADLRDREPVIAAGSLFRESVLRISQAETAGSFRAGQPNSKGRESLTATRAFFHERFKTPAT